MLSKWSVLMRGERGRLLKNLIGLWLLLWFEFTFQKDIENGVHEKGQKRSVKGTTGVRRVHYKNNKNIIT